jgi:hypothetical protein
MPEACSESKTPCNSSVPERQHVQQQQDTARNIHELEERGSALLQLCSERAHRVVLLTEVADALVGQCALDPDAAFMTSSIAMNRRRNSRQWNKQAGVPALVTDDGCCVTVAELMELCDKLSMEKVRFLDATTFNHVCTCAKGDRFVIAGRPVAKATQYDEGPT